MKGYQVTLTTADTNYHLLALVRAIDSGFIDSARNIAVQADDDNGDTILVGDSALSGTRFGAELSATDAMSVGINLSGVYVRSASNSQKLNVFVER